MGCREKYRIPRQLEMLKAPLEVIAEAEALPKGEQEEVLLRYVKGKHAAIVDWRASVEDLYEEIVSLLSPEELKRMPPIEDMPQNVSLAIARLRRDFSDSQRALVHTESFGDFSILFLVPRDRESAFIDCVGAWLITDEVSQ